MTQKNIAILAKKNPELIDQKAKDIISRIDNSSLKKKNRLESLDLSSNQLLVRLLIFIIELESSKKSKFKKRSLASANNDLMPISNPLDYNSQNLLGQIRPADSSMNTKIQEHGQETPRLFEGSKAEFESQQQKMLVSEE